LDRKSLRVEWTATQRPVPVISPSTIRQRKIKLAIENKLSELKGLNAKLAEFLDEHGITGSAAYAVNLAIDEPVVNVMRYAYVEDDTHFIDVELVIDGKQVILRIEDDGRPFDRRRGPSLDLHAEDREAGGLELVLVLDMVDVLKYRREEDKNCVEVRVHLTTDVKADDLSSGD
jgi:anti-sigma regulatory factor (Ser/Thr protein kinase)